MVSYHSQLGYDDQIVTVRSGGAEVRSTYHHPYWVVCGEDLADRPVPDQLDQLGMSVEGVPGRWVDAGDLRVGDVLLSRSGGQSTVESVYTEHEQTTVYHIYVEDSHNYAVGDGEWLVHNAHKSGPEHKGSAAYKGESHVYVIKAPDKSVYKVGKSSAGKRLRDGASKRAEAQISKLNSDDIKAGGKGGYRSQIR